jgi:hypothetical protein
MPLYQLSADGSYLRSGASLVLPGTGHDRGLPADAA